MAFKVVIPARYASTRLPGKPLREIAGRPMIRHVHDRACESGAEEVIIATDDERVAEAAVEFGAEVAMTRADHQSGTDRIAEVVQQREWDPATIIVNLQGDEPCMPPVLIDQVAADMAAYREAGMSTLASPIRMRAHLFDPHVVKVVLDEEGFALYFSRAPVPWHRDEFMSGDAPLPANVTFLRHIGLYAYRAGFLAQYVDWPPAPIEMAEALEQLRVLWHGGRIHVALAAEEPGHGVDNPADLKRAEAMLSSQAGAE